METATKTQLIPQPHGGALRNWLPGQSGNPGGTRTAGAVYREWLNAMSGWSKEALQEVADDEDAAVVQRQAARTHLRALSDGFFNATPLAANDLDRISDRTEGKPTQRIEVAKVERRPDAILSDLAALLRDNPSLGAELPVDFGHALLPVSTQRDSVDTVRSGDIDAESGMMHQDDPQAPQTPSDE